MSEERLYQVHLDQTGMSGRGVRFRLLDEELVRKCEEEGARLAGKEPSLVQMRNSQLHMALCYMIREISEPVEGKRTNAEGEEVPRKLTDEGVEWTKVRFSDLNMVDGPKGWKRFFGAKDTDGLQKLYSRYHEVNAFELNELVGKALPVASEG